MSSGYSERYRPGLLDLGLNASKKEGEYQLETNKRTCDLIATTYSEFLPTFCAAKNFKGTMLYFEKNYHSALAEFQDILKRDKNNLNARQNLIDIYRELGYWSKADEFESDEILEDPQFKARCQGEQAFALMFDSHVAVYESERYKRGLYLLSECKQNKFENEEENIQWILWYLQLIVRSLFANKPPESSKECIQHSLTLLVENVFSRSVLKDPKNSLLQSTAFVVLARLLDMARTKHEAVFKTFEELGFKESWKRDYCYLSDIEAWFENRELCYKKAYDTCLFTESIVRYQRCLKLKHGTNKEKKTNLEKALQLSESADKKLDDLLNNDWFCVSTQADIYLELFRVKCKLHDEEAGQEYSKKMEDNTNNASTEEVEKLRPNQCSTGAVDGGSKIPKSESTVSFRTVTSSVATKKLYLDDLNQCIEYGEKAEKLNRTSELFNNMALSYHEKASCEDNHDQKEGYFLKACSYFLHAIKHCDGKRLPYVHVGLGNCLLEMKQYRPAIESFKRAIEYKTKNQNVYKFMIIAYIELFKQKVNSSHHKKMEDRLLREICSWLKEYKDVKGKLKTDNGNVHPHILDEIIEEKLASDGEPNNNAVVIARMVASFYENYAKESKDVDRSEDFLKHVISHECLQQECGLSLLILAGLVKMPHIDLKWFDFICSCIKVGDGHRTQIEVKTVADAFICCQTAHKCDIHILPLFRTLVERNCTLAKMVCEALPEEHSELAKIMQHVVGEGNCDFSDRLDEGKGNSTVRTLLLLKDAIRPELHRHYSQIEQQLISANIQLVRYRSQVDTDEKNSEPRTRHMKYDYDFCVVSSESDKDRDYIINKLLPTLEEIHGFKGCFEERDSRAGQQKLTEVQNQIDKSFKILIVISDDFLTDAYCKYKLHLALNGKMGESDVIPLMLVNRRDVMVPQELNTVIAVESCDLEKLVRALEEEPKWSPSRQQQK